MGDEEILVDFKRDWTEISLQKLQSWGYSIDSRWGPEEICIRYLNVLKRKISQTPRKVELSADFIPLESDANAVDLIIRKAEKGEDLTQHQSKWLTEPDRLHSHWDIHHFHLGITSEPSGFIKRTGRLLFARVTDTHFYVIGVFNHKAWARQSLIEILHRNWPEEMSKYQIPFALGLECNISDEDLRLLRDAGVNTLIQVPDGKVYGSVGGGYSMSGLSADAIREYKSYVYFFKECEEYIRNNITELVDIAREQGVEILSPFAFRLELNEVDAYAIEINSQFRFLLGYH